MTAADNAAKPHVVWAFTDNKPGHQNQTQGLLKALGVYMPIAVQWLPAPGPLAALRDLLLKRFPAGADFDAPDLLIGAGHGTHLPMLAARRAR
ncbi:MAG TPA: ELM1/GtrOC1 family putative glycosyltransferase, partial [Acidiferrobacterales bacterium]